jgi:acetyl-CoA carboxylase biotin carboxyl carrier protein
MATHTVDSPLPGIVYLSPSPGTPPFKSAGDAVEVGDTLALIEVMKSFIPIEAEVAGTFGRYVAAGDAVLEPGQPLCEIEV